ncbi:ROK family protein [Streptomyces noursei]|nr:ROK family protein [Streptomyces noursei]
MRRAAVGVDVGGTKMLMLAQGGELLGADISRRVGTGPETGPAELEKAIEEFLVEHRLEPTALGVAVPGLVESGRVEVSDVLPQRAGWNGPVTQAPCSLLVNDIRAALAQETATLPVDATAAVVVCGTAVGSAYLSEGRVVRGARGWAGEIGSLPQTTPQGVRRLDELAGGGAIVSAARMPPGQIHTALSTGDRRVQAIVHAAGHAFGLALASLINMLNPHAVRVAGGTLTYRGYWDTALEAAREHSLPELWHACTVTRIDHPEPVVARGAVRLATAMADGHAWVRQYL